MDFIAVGRLVNTHGIKGEVRIISDFKYKSRVFVPGFFLYIGVNKEKVTIKSFRHHKKFEMCVFDEYNYINDVLKFKGNFVFIDRNDLNLSDNEYLDQDLINLNAFSNNKRIGIVEKIINNNGYKLFLVNDKYIPFNDNFILKIDLNKKEIVFKNLEGIL